MGWIEERPGRNPRALVRVQGNKRQKTFPTVREAEQWMREQEGENYRRPAERDVGRRTEESKAHTPSLTQWVKHKCRCAECDAIYKAYRRERYALRRAKIDAGEQDVAQHGLAGYNLGCPCEICKEAGAQRRDEYRGRRAELWRNRTP